MSEVSRNHVIKKILKENFEFRKLSEEHEEFETKLETLAKKKYVDEQDEHTKKTLQKKKLSGKDRMEELIAEYELRHSKTN